MKPRLLKTDLAQYEAALYPGRNTSGIKPFGDNVLVLPDKAAGSLTKSGLLLATEETQERHSNAATSGTVFALGDDAFTWNAMRTKKFDGTRPVAGDRVLFQRYAGALYVGKDGQTYRLMSESCIAGLMNEEEAADVAA